ncbi:cytochrome c biogenesis protein CcsA [Clostridium aceticum]|uniref:Heme exporter protein C n=1 Tax=Clostridium aceticum TaxID=84022 RepID=A0A0D8I928_9CLOT|nr:c-type cytochrome biogenesis protein CcsB [Clostridium aceticum]AKL95663.1 cytochrome c biogenesis protein CcsA [Clostridium aceticum]KJF26773.1 cytochrome C biogenesis protein ResC [Clostridium aceticum]
METQNLLQLENSFFNIAISTYIITMVLYFLFFVMKNEKIGIYATFLIKVAFVLHTLAIAARGVGAERVPLTNQYEFATSFAWGIALCFIIFEHRYHFRAMGTFVTPIIFLIIGYAAMQSKDVRPLMPALQSYWLALHVATAVISYGAFGVACGVSCMYLLKDKFKKDEFISKHMPTLEKLDAISYRATALGFLFLTLVIVTGAIWAEQAWGRYWAWDPKETWSFITWIIYSVYLHLRLTKGWRGKKAALFSVIGFACVLFTYIGVNTLLPSIHSYA